MKVKPFDSSQIIKPLKDSTMFLARETAAAAKNDPALAMRLTATGLVSPIMDGVAPAIAQTTEATIVPIVRLGLLAANTYRAVRTFQDPSTGFAERALDGVRVASDLAGAAGGIAMLFFPQYAGIGAKLVGTAYAVDIVSHAFRSLTHAGDRIKAWQTDSVNDGPANEPPPPPPSTFKTLPVYQQQQLNLFDGKPGT
jgi:hypothetical protein